MHCDRSKSHRKTSISYCLCPMHYTSSGAIIKSLFVRVSVDHVRFIINSRVMQLSTSVISTERHRGVCMLQIDTVWAKTLLNKQLPLQKKHTTSVFSVDNERRSAKTYSTKLGTRVAYRRPINPCRELRQAYLSFVTTCSSAETRTLLVSRPRTNFGHKAFNAAGPRVWNCHADRPQTVVSDSR